jgi:hypothetical protein
MNARRLKLMKPTAVIVNTSRGEVIDENALTRGLRAGEIAGAGLDVFEHGPEVNPRLRELPNVVLLPHMGSATVEGRVEMGEKVILNIKTFADGHRPPDQVVPARLRGAAQLLLEHQQWDKPCETHGGGGRKGPCGACPCHQKREQERGYCRKQGPD